MAAISTKFTSGDIPPEWFEMPFTPGPGGHAVSGLDSPCVVKANWLVRLPAEDVERASPGVSARQTKLVLNWLKQQSGRDH